MVEVKEGVIQVPSTIDDAPRYAAFVYHMLSISSCPGTEGHEGTSPGLVSAIFCDKCLEEALAEAWRAGYQAANLASTKTG